MILIHDKTARGVTRTGWLESHHSFSFGGFSDPNRMGHGALRVINEDRIVPGSGFAPHAHEQIDILTYVLAGALRHEDSDGNVSVIKAGEMQLMAAGAALTHSEMNASGEAPAHFYQVWIIPERVQSHSDYHQAPLPAGKTVEIAAPGGTEALFALRSPTRLTLLRTEANDRIPLTAAADERLFVQIIDGLFSMEGERLSAGDGLQFAPGDQTSLTAQSGGELLVFRMSAQPHNPA